MNQSPDCLGEMIVRAARSGKMRLTLSPSTQTKLNELLARKARTRAASAGAVAPTVPRTP